MKYLSYLLRQGISVEFHRCPEHKRMTHVVMDLETRCEHSDDGIEVEGMRAVVDIPDYALDNPGALEELLRVTHHQLMRQLDS